MKRFLILISCLAILLIFTACDSGDKVLVGVSMPTADENQRWAREGELIKDGLKKAGYDVDIQYGDNTFYTQMKHIENMIRAGVQALIITPADSNTLKTILEEAAKAEIFVILHDRIIFDTPYITALSTYNDNHVGALQAGYMIEALELEDTDRILNMEILSGDYDDYHAYQAYAGALSLLNKYIYEDKLNVVSGQQEFEDTVTIGATSENAYERMKELLATYYTDKDIHAVYAFNDAIASGVIDALDEAGKPYPVIITGQDADPNAVANILDGKQTVSIFKDPIIIAERTVKLTDQILKGEEFETNTVSENNSKSIPTYINPLSIVDKVSYRELLIETGYYKESDFK